MRISIASAIASGLAAVALLATVSAVTLQPAGPSPDFGVAPSLATDADTVPPVAASLIAGPIPLQSSDPKALAAQTEVSPDRIAIPAVGIDMPVVAKGLAPDGSMALPNGAATAAWYRHGGTPGDGGSAALIAAHVATDVDGVGPFALLPQVQQGDQVTVTLSDGNREPFTVVKLKRISKQTVDYDAITVESSGMLILVTCGGDWDPRSRSYEDNVIVWAVSAVVP
jgi:LPXTG-site transpeptidase (sortase) family protein